MALCHYYQGSLNKAEFYIIRFLKGDPEPIDSEIRNLYLNSRKNYITQKLGILPSEDKEQVKTIFEAFYYTFENAYTTVKNLEKQKAISQQREDSKELTLHEKYAKKMREMMSAEENRRKVVVTKQTKEDNMLKSRLEAYLLKQCLTYEEVCDVPLSVQECENYATNDEVMKRINFCCA